MITKILKFLSVIFGLFSFYNFFLLAYIYFRYGVGSDVILKLLIHFSLGCIFVYLGFRKSKKNQINKGNSEKSN